MIQKIFKFFLLLLKSLMKERENILYNRSYLSTNAVQENKDSETFIFFHFNYRMKTKNHFAFFYTKSIWLIRELEVIEIEEIWFVSNVLFYYDFTAIYLNFQIPVKPIWYSDYFSYRVHKKIVVTKIKLFVTFTLRELNFSKIHWID